MFFNSNGGRFAYCHGCLLQVIEKIFSAKREEWFQYEGKNVGVLYMFMIMFAMAFIMGRAHNASHLGLKLIYHENFILS